MLRFDSSVAVRCRWRAVAFSSRQPCIGPRTRPATHRRCSVKATAVSPKLDSCLDLSLALAGVRAQEHNHQGGGLLLDPFSAHAAQGQPCLSPREHTIAAISTAYLDEMLLKATSLTSQNTINAGDYRQVVLVGDALDTRPFRLAWDAGTVLFLVAPQAAHEAAKDLLKTLPTEQTARVPRGCLLRRVNAELQEGAGFMDQLIAAGFRSDRVSVWGLQGLSMLELSNDVTSNILTEVTSAAAFHSLVFGDLPPMSHHNAESLIAAHGLLASLIPYGGEALDYGRWQEEWSWAAEDVQPWMFASQHVKLSLVQLGVYEAHSAAADETDEDFFGNFS